MIYSEDRHGLKPDKIGPTHHQNLLGIVLPDEISLISSS